jgi:RND superfamily putative drug exporter
VRAPAHAPTRHDPGAARILTEIGFCVAIGVQPDTIIVRSVLVTALNLDIGDRMWWPIRLARPSGQVTGAPGTPGTPVTTGHP